MAATIQIVEKNSSLGTETQKDGGTVRFKTIDSAVVDNNNPIVVPAAGSNWSFQKWLRVNVTVAPATQIANIRAYTGGTNPWSGVNQWWKDVGAFAAPIQESSSAGYTNAFSYTAAAALSLSTNNLGPYTGTGEKGDHLVMALEVTSSASSGQLAASTITFAWDEI